METIHALLQERNAFETEPFLAVHNSNAALNTTVIEIKHRCDVLLMENESQKDELDRVNSFFLLFSFFSNLDYGFLSPILT